MDFDSNVGYKFIGPLTLCPAKTAPAADELENKIILILS
jgi:hypothetical protein